MQPIDLEISTLDVLLRLGAAIATGALLGLNRELRDKPAGLKTHTLVSLGAAILTVVGIGFSGMATFVDPSAAARVVQGVITGIGFLGAGVILRGSTGREVYGLTTAATIWLAACVGIACGAGQWTIAWVSVAAILLILVGGDALERALERKWRGRDPDANGSPER